MNITIIGSGVYGLAMAKLLLHNKNIVTLWTEKENPEEIEIPLGAKITNSYEEALQNAKIIYILTGSKFCESVIKKLKNYTTKDMIFIIGSKGILETGKLIIDVFEEILPENKYAVISGPTFAQDIGALEPLGFTLASKEKEIFDITKTIMKSIKLEYSSDVVGTSLCGSLKNAYAIGSGMLSGFNYGYSARCLYVTRVINEMKDIFEKRGALKDTALTLAGIGDLMLTCTSSNSRNFTLGSLISRCDKEEIKVFLESHTVEGYENLKIFHKIFKEKSIEAPILNMVYEILNENKDPKEILNLIIR